LSRQKQGVRLNATDFYPTPSWCYKNLEIDWNQFASALEPCRGDGRIYDWLKTHIKDVDYCEIREDRDFLEYSTERDLVFTNPPFSIAQEFIDRSVSISNTVFMLLRINYLGSISRHEWWKAQPPVAMYVLSKRPSFTGKGTDATDYAWFVWDKTERITRGIHFVSPPSKEQATEDNKLCAEALANANTD